MGNLAIAPMIKLKPGREKPVRQRHPWIFSGSIQALPPSIPDGGIADVCDSAGNWLGRGYVNRASQIRVRLLTWDESEVVDDAFWYRRLAAAVDRRAALRLCGPGDACRLVNGESDYVPGLIVDRYGDYLTFQAGTLGIDIRKRMLAGILQELCAARGVFERSDTAARSQEGLTDSDQILAGSLPPSCVEITENDLRFYVDLTGGQKTGFYLDQRENRCRVARYCQGRRVLNAFSYTGAFAAYALRAQATHVTNLDTSIDALELGERNLRLNGQDPDMQAVSIAGDVFQVLRDWRNSNSPEHIFDLVILDPPKFAHSKAQVERALRGYKDINLLALQLLRPGGILATFSCSGLVSADLFQKVVFGAAVDAGRSVQIVERLHQSPDHPVAITFPEGEYLKGLICAVGR